jgi:beta-galactosidase
MSEKTLFCDGWQFSKQGMASSIDDIKSFQWRKIDIPHDWLVWQTKNLYESSNGFYKKCFMMTGDEPHVSLRFEGVYQDSSVYINGKIAFKWKYGYSTFEFEITDFLKKGENEIVVLVRHHAPNSRWYSGAGIYRNVYMIIREKTHFTPDGIYFSAFKKDGKWTCEIKAEISGGQDKNLAIRHTLIAGNGNTPGSAGTKADGETVNCSLPIDNSSLEIWDIENPVLYTLKSELVDNGTVIDTEYNTVGFRTVEFSPNNGFLLNGRQVKLNGVCLHHDLGALGAAFNKTALRRQLLKMIEMGANAVRTSHNMPAKELMELTDELGLLVISEAFDMWQLPKTKYDYARFFDEWVERDVASWIRRDRNHPSLIMWSIGNEIYDTHSKHPDALEVTKLLNSNVLKHDPNRNGGVTIGSNYVAWEGAQKCADVIKLSGYNYLENCYKEHRVKYPDWFIYGSETASRIQSRGIYHFPASSAVITYEDAQCSSLENCRSGHVDRTASYNLIFERDTPFSGGQFIWTGSDYIGEPSPYSTKNSYFGQIDTAGFEKDGFYLYKVVWNNNNGRKSQPILHLFPYWDFNEGQMIDVFAYSNLPKVELFLNGKSIGTEEIDIYHGDKLTFKWRLPYEKGTIKAVGYDQDGKIVCETKQSSFSDGVKIVPEADKQTINADGEDLAFVSISTVDKDGNFVANAKSRMNVKVSGAGRLVGLDSGDSTDYDEYKGSSKKLFGGKLLAIIAAKTEASSPSEPDEIKIEVSSKGFPPQTLVLKALPAEAKKGISCLTGNFISPVNEEIPVRKIELKAQRLTLNQDNRTSEISAVCFPLDCDTPKLEWKAVTNSGIETNIAKVTAAAGGKAVVTAIGDGDFRLRCTCSNGKKFTEIISDLEFSVTGLGAAVIDPYKMVLGAMYTSSNVKLTEDLEGGVSPQKEMTYICFENVDFGAAGSGKITLPIIHWFTGNPLPIEIWDGMPDKNGKKLFSGEYKADFKWQTYQENTFTLSEKMTGIKTVCIALRQVEHKVSLKGFYFERKNRSYEKIPALSNSRIFGDSFTVNRESGIIENIGNNVTIEFDNMDFDRGFSSLTVCGRTHNALDSIHVIFAGESGSERHLIEFEKTSDLTEKTFPLKTITGLFKVTFWFLPGSNFDFEWFRFE